MGLLGRNKDPEAGLAKALAARGTQGRAMVVSMRETGNERDVVANEIVVVEVQDLG